MKTRFINTSACFNSTSADLHVIFNQASIGVTLPKQSRGFSNHIDTLPWIASWCLQSTFANVIKPNTYYLRQPCTEGILILILQMNELRFRNLNDFPRDTQMWQMRHKSRFLYLKSSLLWLLLFLIVKKANITGSLQLIKVPTESRNPH